MAIPERTRKPFGLLYEDLDHIQKENLMANWTTVKRKDTGTTPKLSIGKVEVL